MTAKQEPKISPDLYRQTLQSLTLRQVSLERIDADCSREVVDAGEVVVEVNYEAKFEQTQNNYFAFITYFLQSEHADKPFLRLEATYRVTFNKNIPIPDGFAEVFEHLNLRITTMPYFRELVASTTGRMELPTLTLPYEIVASKTTNQPPITANTRKVRAKKTASTL